MEITKRLFLDKKKLFATKLNLGVKKQIIKCLVLSVAIYAVEVGKLTKAEK